MKKFKTLWLPEDLRKLLNYLTENELIVNASDFVRKAIDAYLESLEQLLSINIKEKNENIRKNKTLFLYEDRRKRIQKFIDEHKYHLNESDLIRSAMYVKILDLKNELLLLKKIDGIKSDIKQKI